MATNKNALIRYKILDQCFRNPAKRYYIHDLIAACNKVMQENDPDSGGISRRQLFNDISFMESPAGWNIDLVRHKDGKEVYYRYADTSYSINNMPLNELEVNSLETSLSILSQFKGMPHFEWVHELIPKLRQGMSAEKDQPPIIEFDSNQYLKGIEHLGTLHLAIYYEKVLDITYQPYEMPEPYHLQIHPYFLKQYNNRWFLYGYNPAMDKYDWNLALDRIVDIRETREKYRKNSVIDWREYFEDIIGVTHPENANAENIILRFYGKSGHYIATKPLHGSQKSKWLPEGILEVRLRLKLNYELERLILSYGEDVAVVSPNKLKEVIRRRLKKAVEIYGVA